LLQKKPPRSQLMSPSALQKSLAVTSEKGNRKAGISSIKSVETKTPTTTLLDQQQIDIKGLNLYANEESVQVEEPPKVAMTKEKLLEEVKKSLDPKGNSKKSINLVIIGMNSCLA
jgi:hypothetical protein